MLVKKQRFFYGWIIVATVTVMLFFAISNPINVVLKQLIDEFHSNRGMVSLAPSFSTIAAGMAGLFIGKLLINRSPRKFMLLGVTIGGICLLLISLTQELWQVYVLYFLSGVAMSGAGTITVFTLLSKWFKKKFGTATGIIMAGGGIGYMIIAPLFGVIAENFGWRATYIFIGTALMIITIPLILFVLKDSPESMELLPDGETNSDKVSGKKMPEEPHPQGNKLKLSAYLKSPALWVLGFSIAFIQISENAVTIHQVSFLTDMKISATIAASALGFTMGFSTIARLGSGWLADRISSRYVAIVFIAIEIVGMLLLLRVQRMSDVWLFVVVYGLGAGATSTLMPILLRDVFGSAAFSMLLAILDVFFKIGLSLGAPFAGFMFDATGSYHLVFTIVIILYIIAAILLYFAFGANPRPFKKIRRLSNTDDAPGSLV